MRAQRDWMATEAGAAVEMVSGLLFIAGLLTRPAAIPLVVDMTVAIWTTTIPILMKQGFWAMAHEARTDWYILLGSVFLMLTGAGAWSIDAKLAEDHRSRQHARNRV